MVAGAVFTLLAALSLWSWRTFANSDGFADVTTDMLREPAVAEVVANQVVVVLENQDSVARASATARPLLREIVKDVVQTDAFRGLFHAGARELHASVMAGYRTKMQVQVNDAASLVKDALLVVNPGLANAIPDETFSVLVGVSQNRRIDLAMRAADLAGWLILPFAGFAALCFVLGVHRAADRRLALELVGGSLLAVGIVDFIVLGALLVVAADIGEDPLHRTALRAVFWSLMHVLNVTAKLLMVAGASLALAAALAGTNSLEDRIRGIGQASRIVLTRPAAKGLAATAVVATGVVGLVWPLATGQVLVRVAAVGMFTLGLVWLFDLVGAASWVVSANGSALARRRFAVVATGVLVCVPLVLIVGGMAFVRALRPTALERADIHDTGCNLSRRLCDRPVTEVAFAATHNSMAASAEGYLGARQTGGIGAQLAGGIRAFLIDLHYGTRWKDVARTDFGFEATQGFARTDVGPREQASVALLLGTLGAAPPPTDRSVFLCHVYCELGATPARAAFAEIRDFLRVNRNEVVILVLEDHVSAKDAVKVIERSGLATRAYVWTTGHAAPTLRSLIDTGKNVIILVENHGGEVPSAPWYMPAYGGLLQDTEFQFDSLASLRASDSCKLLRGRPEAPLFLINEWVDTGTPDPVLAADVNGEVLADRVKACARARHHLPNIVAVDFYTRGDLIGLVDELNGYDPSAQVVVLTAS